jgi:hypothetical protein
MVQYTVKPERAAENQQLIETVFEALRQTTPAGLHYEVFKKPDGITFVHIASVDDAIGENPLPKLPAFQAFQVGIQDRCDIQPVSTNLTAVAAYKV